MPNIFEEIRQCAAELTAKWKTQSTGGPSRVSPIDEVNRLSLETCTLAFHGIKLNCITAANEHSMIAAMEGATSEAMKRPNRPRLLNWCYQSYCNRDTKTMRTYAASMLKERKHNPQPDRRDMLYALMNRQDPETGEGLNQDTDYRRHGDHANRCIDCALPDLNSDVLPLQPHSDRHESTG